MVAFSACDVTGGAAEDGPEVLINMTKISKTGLCAHHARLARAGLKPTPVPALTR